MRDQRSAKKASPKKKLAAQEDASVTESEQSEEEDSLVHVEEPGTQFVPERRNEGSLDLYSDGEDKFS